MPNRILKERICTSSDIAQLSWLEEVFYYRLIVTVDDYGLFDARIPILKSRLFPLNDITNSTVEACLNKVRSLDMVSTYMVKDEPYLEIVSWESHQQIRSQKAKFPKPEMADGVVENPLNDIEIARNKRIAQELGLKKDFSCDGNQMISDDINGNQMISDDIRCYRNPIQSESNPNPNPNPESESKIYCPAKPPDDVSEIPYALIVDCLNRVVGTKYRSSSQKTRRLIKARWKEGFRLEDFEKVIAKKAKEWMGTDMEKYLWPETLFGPKFEGYLNQSTGRRMSDAERIARL